MRKIVAFLFLIACIGTSYSQTNKFSLNLNKDRNLWQAFTYDLGNIAGGMGYAYTRPLHWQGEQFKNAGYVAAGTGALFLVDDKIKYQR